MGAAGQVGTVRSVDRFEEIMAAEPGLSRHFALMRRVWDDTAEGVDAVRALCENRRLITRCTVSFSAGPAAVVLDCGPVALECRLVPERAALELARIASGPGVDLRVAGFEPSSDGWALTVTAHCDTPFPFRALEVPMRSLNVERQRTA